jgi:hypothetical protein
VPIEDAPQHRTQKVLAAILDQALMDLEEVDVWRAPAQPHEVVTMGFDPSRAAIAAASPWRYLPSSRIA